MSTKTQSKSSYASIDVAKFIMAILVLTLHTNPLHNRVSGFAESLYGSLLHSAVPFFFLSTGFLLKKSAGTSDHNIRIVIRRHLRKVIKMYFIWHLVYLPLSVFHFVTNDYSVLKSILVTIRALFLVGKNFNSDILWYMLASIYALIFVSFLKKFNLRTSLIILLGGLLHLFGLFLPVITSVSNHSPQIVTLIKKVLTLAIPNGRIFSGFFYIPIGMMLADMKLSTSLGITLFLAGLTGNCLLTGIPGSMLLSIQAIGTFIAVASISLTPAPIYIFLRKSSTNIYFLHQYIAFMYCFLAGNLHRQTPDVFFVTLVVSLLLSSGWILFQSRHP